MMTIQISQEIQTARLGITLISMFLAWMNPSYFESSLALPLLLIILGGLVIPHGALDHIAFYQLYSQRYSIKAIQRIEPRLVYWIPRVIFYVHYLLIMALWGLFWRTLMPVTFVIFLILSAYHFGEGDLDYIDLCPMQALPLMLSRGLFLLSLTLFSQPLATIPIVQQFMHFPDSLAKSGAHEFLITSHFGLLGLYALVYSQLFPQLSVQTSHFPVTKESPAKTSLWMREIGKSVLFYTLFSCMNSLVAFSIYLGPWHAVGHMLSEISFLKSESNPAFTPGNQVTWKDLGNFLWTCFPFTAIAVLSMLSAFWISTEVHSISYDDVNAWVLFIISISIFTGPHLWIVAGLHSMKTSMDPLGLKEQVLTLFSENHQKKSFGKVILDAIS